MTSPIFDTHRAVKDLEEAGFEESQAEAVVGMMSSAIGENVATRSDLQGMQTNLQAEFQPIRSDIVSLEDRMTARMESLEDRMTARMESLEHRMTIKLGAFVFAGAGAVVALLKLLS